jgi:double-strand break repair protein MRE11
MKQTTLDSSLGFRQSQRSASAAASAAFKSASTIGEDDVDSPSSEEVEPEDFNKPDSSSVWTIPYTVIHLFTTIRKPM